MTVCIVSKHADIIHFFLLLVKKVKRFFSWCAGNFGYLTYTTTFILCTWELTGLSFFEHIHFFLKWVDAQLRFENYGEDVDFKQMLLKYKPFFYHIFIILLWKICCSSVWTTCFSSSFLSLRQPVHFLGKYSNKMFWKKVICICNI